MSQHYPPQPLPACLKTLGVDRNRFNYLRRESALWTRYVPTSRGAVQQVSFENHLELAFVSALTRMGMDAFGAGVVARTLLKQMRTSALPEYYVGNTATGQWQSLGKAAADGKLAGLLGMFPDWAGGGADGPMAPRQEATSLAILSVGEIVRRARVLFLGVGE